MFIPQQETEAAQQSEMEVYTYSIWGIAVITSPSYPVTVSNIILKGRVQVQRCSCLITQPVSVSWRKPAISFDFKQV